MITVLLMLMFGMVDFGRVMYTSNSLISAAREGARFGAVQPYAVDVPCAIKDTVEARFNSYTFGGDNLKDANITVDGFVGIVASVSQGHDRVPVQVDHAGAAVAGVDRSRHRDYTSTLHSPGGVPVRDSP